MQYRRMFIQGNNIIIGHMGIAVVASAEIGDIDIEFVHAGQGSLFCRLVTIDL